ncbi:MAG TPA: hypothetical protein VGW40_15080 [Allosphingosinicella sp.]|nr:hypothetical protein [Allosphingosinicella sp.]
MNSRTILLTLAGATLIAGGQALAQGRGGGHGGGHGGDHGGASAHGSLGAQMGRGLDVRTDARVHSQGPAHASDRAIERADDSSVLHGTVRPPRTDLSALRAGLTVRTSGGTTLGTIRRVNRGADGSVRSVLIASANGHRTIPVRPGTLSISGDVVTTTQVRPPND